ncbi:hypothetical protein BVI434_280022 [Burkholderia vietnamiensis]|nr:hypothetical protein BVI434_280022 [Burkholderia vietnamiensis]
MRLLVSQLLIVLAERTCYFCQCTARTGEKASRDRIFCSYPSYRCPRAPVSAGFDRLEPAEPHAQFGILLLEPLNCRPLSVDYNSLALSHCCKLFIGCPSYFPDLG